MLVNVRESPSMGFPYIPRVERSSKPQTTAPRHDFRVDRRPEVGDETPNAIGGFAKKHKGAIDTGAVEQGLE
ncbi:hypothetical protein PM082_007816 [Marasmius tenuissimus]|nr:hypothetical protein PM082_007816 [Marasmius tenuissimus]